MQLFNFIGKLILLLVYSSCILGLSSEAKADAFYKFVETSCYPEIGYFSLKTDGIYNVDPEKLYSSNAISSSFELENTPVNCELSEQLTIEIKGYCRIQTSPDDISCTQGGGAGIEFVGVYINGEIIPLGGQSTHSEELKHWMHYYHTKFYPDHTLAISSSTTKKNGKHVPLADIRHCVTPNGGLARYTKSTGYSARTQDVCNSFQMIFEKGE